MLQLMHSPAQLAQWRACHTHDLMVVSLRPGCGELSGIFWPLTSAEVCEKKVVVVALEIWNDSCISTSVRKLGNTCASLTAMI